MQRKPASLEVSLSFAIDLQACQSALRRILNFVSSLGGAQKENQVKYGRTSLKFIIICPSKASDVPPRLSRSLCGRLRWDAKGNHNSPGLILSSSLFFHEPQSKTREREREFSAVSISVVMFEYQQFKFDFETFISDLRTRIGL